MCVKLRRLPIPNGMARKCLISGVGAKSISASRVLWWCIEYLNRVVSVGVEA